MNWGLIIIGLIFAAGFGLLFTTGGEPSNGNQHNSGDGDPGGY